MKVKIKVHYSQEMRFVHIHNYLWHPPANQPYVPLKAGDSAAWYKDRRKLLFVVAAAGSFLLLSITIIVAVVMARKGDNQECIEDDILIGRTPRKCGLLTYKITV